MAFQSRSGTTGQLRAVSVEIAIISDTHMPRGERRLPDACVERLRAADLIIHAGDLMHAVGAARAPGATRRVVAVHGNVDDAAVRAALPAAATRRGRRAQDRGRPRRRPGAGPARAAATPVSRTPTPSSSGTRTCRCTSAREDGFQIFNPGSPTERRRAPAPTMGMAARALRRQADVRAHRRSTDRLRRDGPLGVLRRHRRLDPDRPAAGCPRCSCAAAATASCSTAARAPSASSCSRSG